MNGWAWIRLHAVAVYVFMFLPVAVVVLLSFNDSQFGSFPMTGVSFRWFVKLWHNEAIIRAFKTSFVLGGLTAIISTTMGVLASLAMVRYFVRVGQLQLQAVNMIDGTPLNVGDEISIHFRHSDCVVLSGRD